MIKLASNVWKFSGFSNVYLLISENKGKILIDSGDARDGKELLDALKKISIDAQDIDIIIFTHLHYDHLGNYRLFKNAELYASAKELKTLRENPYGTVLNKGLAEELNEKMRLRKISIKDASEISSRIPEIKIINTPGHTSGSICIFYERYEAEKILFSGDTLFNGCHGRTDLPTSVESEIKKSLNRLTKYDYRILCAGHDY